MRILVTGASGFVGRHLSRHLLTFKNTEVFGLCRKRPGQKCVPGVREVYGDILDKASLKKTLRTIRPDRVYHLAGQSSVKDSWSDPKATFRVNVEGTENLLEAVLASGKLPRVHIAGSAEVYGAQGSSGGRLREKIKLKPINPYGRSKAAQEAAAMRYFKKQGLPIIVTRAFNHIGPGQDERFVTPSFAKQVVRIEHGLQRPEIEVGNLDVVRDFTDVRDVVRGYHRALEKGRPGEVYNVASGKARRVREILQFYLKNTSVRIEVRPKESRLRKADIQRLVGDTRKIARDTGWRPKIAFERSLKDILTDWRNKKDV